MQEFNWKKVVGNNECKKDEFVLGSGLYFF
jgi:hypothetical protein